MNYRKDYRRLKELYQIPADELIKDIVNFRLDRAKNELNHDYFIWEEVSSEHYYKAKGVNQFDKFTNSKYYYPLYNI